MTGSCGLSVCQPRGCFSTDVGFFCLSATCMLQYLCGLFLSVGYVGVLVLAMWAFSVCRLRGCFSTDVGFSVCLLCGLFLSAT